MRYPISTIAAATLLSAVTFADAEDGLRSCKFEVKPRCASGEARVQVRGGAATSVSINVFWCGRKGTPGYSCVVEYKPDDGKSKWSEESGATVIDNSSPWNPGQPDRIKVTVGKHVSLDLEEAQSGGACGAGAELPRAIVVPEGKGACRVWLNAP